MKFVEKIQKAIKSKTSHLCVGLDPNIDHLPSGVEKNPDGVLGFCKDIVDATKDVACSYKPQFAYYAAIGAHKQLQTLIEYIHKTTECPVIFDGKRGDIDSTSEQYAKESFDYYRADATTVNPYMGINGMQPFLDYKDKGVIVLCRTSNPEADLIQNLELANSNLLYQEIAKSAANEWNTNSNVLLVAAATRTAEVAEIRKRVGRMTLLVPGVGLQGGDIKEVVLAARGGGLIVNSSRAINYAGKGSDFAEKARNESIRTRDEINDAIENSSDYMEIV